MRKQSRSSIPAPVGPPPRSAKDLRPVAPKSVLPVVVGGVKPRAAEPLAGFFRNDPLMAPWMTEASRGYPGFEGTARPSDPLAEAQAYYDDTQNQLRQLIKEDEEDVLRLRPFTERAPVFTGQYTYPVAEAQAIDQRAQDISRLGAVAQGLMGLFGGGGIGAGNVAAATAQAQATEGDRMKSLLDRAVEQTRMLYQAERDRFGAESAGYDARRRAADSVNDVALEEYRARTSRRGQQVSGLRGQLTEAGNQLDAVRRAQGEEEKARAEAVAKRAEGQRKFMERLPSEIARIATLPKGSGDVAAAVLRSEARQYGVSLPSIPSGQLTPADQKRFAMQAQSAARAQTNAERSFALRRQEFDQRERHWKATEARLSKSAQGKPLSSDELQKQIISLDSAIVNVQRDRDEYIQAMRSAKTEPNPEVLGNYENLLRNQKALKASIISNRFMSQMGDGKQ